MPIILPPGGIGRVLFDSRELTGTGPLDSGAGGFDTTLSTLRILLYMRDTGAGTAVAQNVRFNNDSAADYDFNYMSSQNVTQNAPVISTGQTSAAIGLSTANGATAGRFGVTIIEIPDYGGTSTDKFGTFQSSVINAGGADSFIRVGGVQWHPGTPAAISRVALTSTTLATGSRLIVLAF